MTSVILKLHSESESRSVVSESLWSHGLQPARSLCPWNSPGQNIGVGSRSILQEIFQTQGLNPGLPHCKWILYHLSHQGSPRILQWKVYLFSRGPSWPRDQTGVFCIAGGFFTIWATREAQESGVGSLSLLQGIFPNPGIKPGSPVLQVDFLPAKGLPWWLRG